MDNDNLKRALLGSLASRSLSWKRPVYALPDPEALPFPGGLIRSCEDCGLRAGCTAPVPGENIDPDLDIILVGQNPGRWEDEQGRPFVGQAGRLLDSLLFQARVPRDYVAISNLVKCLTPNNRAPTAVETAACSKWLDMELEVVNPRIIVAMGYPATVHFLGRGIGTMEQLHGKPIVQGSRIILPVYHPAAALHDTGKIRQCLEDFEVLGGLAEGRIHTSFLVKDEYPKPDYRVADSPALLKTMRDDAEGTGEFGLDTETSRGALWSYQVSTRPGTGWFVPLQHGFQGRVDFTGWPSTAVVHFYLHDVRYVKLRDYGFMDTMVMAYLLHLPQGLKELAHRLCGVQMVTYNEMVRPQQQELAMVYLAQVSLREWPDPPVLEETRWDNKKGEIITREKKPWHISRKVTKMLEDLKSDEGVDLWTRWRAIPGEERAVVENVLGSMPEASLADIPLDTAMQYACRDADVTLRVYHKLSKLLDKLDMNFVLDMDLRILPIVDNMMCNGMAVDLEHYRKLSEEYDHRMRVKAAELAALVGHSFNPASSKQVATVVYTELGFNPTRGTPTGLVSTDDAELKKTGHPVAEGIIRYRGLQKLKSTYADNMIYSAYPDPEGVFRMHTVLKTTRVETGRLSSSKADDGTGANLQNIPTRNKEAKAIKNGFIAPPGWLMGEADYGQVEMVTQAHLANCKGLIELFRRGGDPHTETAARLFGVSLEEAAKDKYRYPCKRAGFGIIYMIGPQGLSTQINEYIADLTMEGEPVDIEPWDEATCAGFIEEYYRLYPEIRQYQHRQLIHARRHGYVKDMFGRIRYIPEVVCPIRSIQEAGARMAANMPVTSSAQGIIKLAMVQLWNGLPVMGWQDKVHWLMQIHDSLIFEVVDDDQRWRPILDWVGSVMRGVVTLRVPLKVDFKIGRRWGELEKLN
jgi:uracil-DNA glycosylase family 4